MHISPNSRPGDSTLFVLDRPNGIYKSVVEHLTPEKREVDIDLASGLRLHQEAGKDLVVISQGQQLTMKDCRLGMGHGLFVLPQEDAPLSHIDIEGPVRPDGKGGFEREIQRQCADGSATLLFCKGKSPDSLHADTLCDVSPQGKAELSGFACGSGWVTADGGAAHVRDLDGERNLPFLIAPSNLGHRYPRG